MTLLAVFLIPVSAMAALPSDLTTAVQKIKEVANAVGGSIVIIGWIIAGILYLTSAGSPEKTGTAKKALFAAIIGTILILIANVAASIIENALGGK